MNKAKQENLVQKIMYLAVIAALMQKHFLPGL